MNSSLNSAQDRAYQHLKAEILSLSLKPGQWIKAQDIATVVNVSRTPVREALSRLEQEGFVRRDEGWGYVVSSTSLKEARDLYKVREALEVEAAREAVPNMTPAKAKELDAFLTKSEQARAAKRLATFRANTRSFHVAISSMANNALLARLLSELEGRVQLLGALVFEKHHERMDEVVKENRAVFEALRLGDAAEAESAVRRHVRRAWESYLLYVVEDVGPETMIDNFKETRRNGG